VVEEDGESSVSESSFGAFGGSSGGGVPEVVDCLRICGCMLHRKHIDGGRLRWDANRDEDVHPGLVGRVADRNCSTSSLEVGLASTLRATRVGIVRLRPPAH
jgi:hypothetical protein